MRLILNWLIAAVAILIAAYLLPGVFVYTPITALVLAVVIGLLNAILRPILIVLTLPLTIMTLGLFTLVINTGMIMLADYFVDGFKVESFWWALAFSLILSLVNGFLKAMSKDD